MKIKIMQNNEQKTYSLGAIKGTTYRKFLVIRDMLLEKEKTKEEYTVKDFDDMCDFIVASFGEKFTVEELLDSVDIWDINIYVAEIQAYISKKTQSKIQKLADTL